MTQLEILLKEAADAPAPLLEETLDFLRFLKARYARQGLDATEMGDAEARAHIAHSLQYAAQLYGDEDELLPVEGEAVHVASR